MGATIKQTHYTALPTGTYPAVIGAAELTDGQFGQQVKIRFDLTGELTGRSVLGWASASFGPRSKLYGWARAAIFEGAEIPETYDLDVDHLLDRPVLLTLIEREGDDGQTFNKIDSLKPARGNGMQMAATRPAQPQQPTRPAQPPAGAIPQRRQVTAAGVRASPNDPPDWPDWPAAGEQEVPF